MAPWVQGATADPELTIVQSALGAVEVARWPRRFDLGPSHSPSAPPPSQLLRLSAQGQALRTELNRGRVAREGAARCEVPLRSGGLRAT